MSGEAALAETPDDGPLSLFIGVLHARRRDLDQALLHLRRAADLLPGDPLPRIELARVLADAGRENEAEAALIDLSATGPFVAELARMRARLAEARAAAGQGEAALTAAKAQARALPYDPAVRIAVARLEDLLGRPDMAEAALGEALALDPDCAPALLALADLAERGNRVDEVEGLLARASAAGIQPAETALLGARLRFRRGDLNGALAAARQAPATGDGGARAELTGRILDRLDDPAAAFAAFAEMNREVGLVAPDARGTARGYRAGIAQMAGTVTADWYRGWSARTVTPARIAPAFLFGFPRSGTTLVDTMLAGHDQVAVLEEKPVMDAAAAALTGMGPLAALDPAAVFALREHYFEALDAIEPRAPRRLAVDKHPLGITHVPLIHRLFPDARIIFVERHPCDVVLSGFMARFDPNVGKGSFLDLEDIALLYDALLSMWQTYRNVLPLKVRTVRYERVLAEPETELRGLADFLGLDWDGALLYHEETARRRGHIATPSYAQVTEPLNRRAEGRWRRYRAQLEPVLPILAPWAERLGYEM